MNTNVKYILTFVAGAITGSALTWKLLKSKYEQIAKDEIEFQVERFTRKNAKLNRELEDANDVISTYEKVEKAQVEEYKKTVSERGYTDYTSYSKPDTPEKEEKESSENKPYVIRPEEFVEKDDYDLVNLTYYADEILADDCDGLVENVDQVIGVDSLSRFGDYEDDAVHVRNDRFKCDYEILRDKRMYRDVIGANPHLVED